MRTPSALLKFVAKALANAIGGGVAGDLLVEVLPEVAKDAWEWWSKDRTVEQRRVEVEAIAQTGLDELRQQVAEVVQEVASDKSLQVRQAVEAYLTEVPASIRRSLRRASDPTGTTVPADLVPKKADDLLRLLPARLPRFKPGSRPLFGVDWVLEQLLGVGGFGEVWKAINPHLSSVKPVALKFCLDPGAARVLRNEAAVLDRVLRQGKHAGIVQLLHTYLSAEIPCLEYEYVEGGDLTGLIQEWHRARGGPTLHHAAKVILRLAEIVGFAHKLDPPIVHRDLKPANILVQRSAAGETHFKVADFGIGGVAVRQAIRETSSGNSRGRFLTSAVHGSYTPLYASPQQMRGDPPDTRDDVYSLGVIWYQLLTGDLANGRPGGSRWRKKLSEQGMPSEMADVLESCFEDNPSDRPSDATSLLAELVRLLKAESYPLSPPSAQVAPIAEVTSVKELTKRSAALQHPHIPTTQASGSPGAAKTASLRYLATYKPRHGVSQVGFSEHDSLLLAYGVGAADRGGFVGCVTAWDMVSHKEVYQARTPVSPDHFTCHFDDTGRYFAFHGKSMLVLHDALSGKKIRAFGGGWFTKRLNCSAFFCSSEAGLAIGADPNPDGKYTHSEVVLWDMATGKETRRLDTLPAQIAGGRFVPGTKQVCLFQLETLLIYNYQTNSIVAEFPLRGRLCTDVWSGKIAMSPCGRYVAAFVGTVNASRRDNVWDIVVRVWDISEGVEIWQSDLLPHSSQLSFSPDSVTLAGASSEGTISVWDINLQREISRTDKHQGAVTGCSFSYDGKSLATSDLADSSSVFVWQVVKG